MRVRNKRAEQVSQQFRMVNQKTAAGGLVLSLLALALFVSCSDNPTSSTTTCKPQAAVATHLVLEPGTRSSVTFDFGYVPQRSKATHLFWLCNGYDDTLRITKIAPG